MGRSVHDAACDLLDPPCLADRDREPGECLAAAAAGADVDGDVPVHEVEPGYGSLEFDGEVAEGRERGGEPVRLARALAGDRSAAAERDGSRLGSLADEAGIIGPEFVWAALDCVGYFATGAPDYPMSLLGRMTAEVRGTPRIDEQCVVVGWSEGREGRKLHAGTAVFGSDRRLLGRARQTWIRVHSTFPPPPPSWRSPPSQR